MTPMLKESIPYKCDAIGARVDNILLDFLEDLCEYGGFSKSPEGGQVHEYMLEEESCIQVGAGHFATVFLDTTTNVVYKIAPLGADDGLVYAAWCRANLSRAGVPEVYHVERYKNCYVVAMKRYVKASVERGGDPYVRDIFRQMQQAITGGSTSALSDPVVTTTQAIYDYFLGVASFDLHSDNVMFDPDTGTLIITDPLGFSRGTETSSMYEKLSQRTSLLHSTV